MGGRALALAQHQQCRSAHSLCSDCRGRRAHACHHDWQDRKRSGIQHSATVHRGVHVAEDSLRLVFCLCVLYNSANSPAGLRPSACTLAGLVDRAFLRFRHIVYSGPVKGLLCRYPAVSGKLTTCRAGATPAVYRHPFKEFSSVEENSGHHFSTPRTVV